MALINYSDFKLLKQRATNSRLLRDSIWAIVGNIIGKGLALAAGIIVARFLGKDIYGEYGIIRSTILSVAIFSTFGLGYTATKYVAEYKNSRPEYIKLILRYSRNITLVISGLMAIGLFLFAGHISKHILEASHLTNPLRLVAIWIVFNALTTTQIGVLAGFGEFKGMARINTIVGITTFITSLVFTYYWKLNGALIALLITQILNWYLNYLLVNKNIPLNIDHKENEKILLKDIIKFSMPVALQEVLFPITAWIINFMLIRLANYGELGLYAAAMQWNALILYIPGILRNVILTHLTESNQDNDRHKSMIKKTLIFNFIMTTIPFFIVLLLSKQISSLYGFSFAVLDDLLKITVFTTLFSSLSNVYYQAYLSKGLNWIMFNFRMFRDLGIITLSLVLLLNTNGNAGAIAVAKSSLLMNCVFLLIIAFFYRRFDKQLDNI